MDIIQRGIRNWQDGRRIEDYCSKRGYPPQDILALREMNRLHLDEADGILGGTPQEALETIARATPQQKLALRSLGQQTYPELCDALIRLTEDRLYADRILS